jgi:DNA ligase-1
MFNPMLAAKIKNISKLRYPLYGSIKYDGIRATMQKGRLLSRTLKPIPNQNVQKLFSHLPDGFDGELMFGDPSAKDVFQSTTSVVMSHDKEATGIRFFAIDQFGTGTFQERSDGVFKQVVKLDDPNVELVAQVLILNEKDLLAFEQDALDAGFEGLILRSVDGPYKEGRSTEKQGWLLKLKRFVDAEAKVLGFYEELENTNEAKINALGHTERSTKKQGMVGKQALGGFDVIGINGQFKDVEFSVGSGMTAEQKKDFWKNRQKLIGKILKYKYFPIGVKDKPRLPIFLGFRDRMDM